MGRRAFKGFASLKGLLIEAAGLQIMNPIKELFGERSELSAFNGG